METLDGTEWDVVIAGTDLPQSLLALALSRSGKRVLHLDPNDYYGGGDAALSLDEAEAWASRYAVDEGNKRFSKASVFRSIPEEESNDAILSSSRAYSLALSPHLIYSRSSLVPAVVSSRTHNQLDFQAVGSWFIIQDGGSLMRVPSSREDVFQDNMFDLKAKRSLMKFLRFVSTYEEHGEAWQDSRDKPFSTFLEDKFSLPPASLGRLLALVMAESVSRETTTAYALPRIARHLRSIGVFGPGFGAVLPKWGGLAEIAQVACRACAVGGGVYVLNKAIEKVGSSSEESATTTLRLNGADSVTTTWLVGANDSLPPADKMSSTEDQMHESSRSISIVSSSLTSLFPPTSEGGVTPAGAIVVMPSSSKDEPPVYVFGHTSEAGECPMGQCVLYASTAAPASVGLTRLECAVSKLLHACQPQSPPRVLWRLDYQQRRPRSSEVSRQAHVLVMPWTSSSLVLEDDVLEHVKYVWSAITGQDIGAFMVFEARDGTEDGDEMS